MIDDAPVDAATFDQVARESTYVVRGTVEQTWSKWDDSHEVIFTYATVRVHRYFGETTTEALKSPLTTEFTTSGGPVIATFAIG